MGEEEIQTRGRSEEDETGPKSGEWAYAPAPGFEQRVRQSFAAWLLWSDPTLAATGIRMAWKGLSARDRNAWRVAVSTARGELVAGLEVE